MKKDITENRTVSNGRNAAVGWQGMEAKAAVTDDTINWLRQGVNLSEWDFTYDPDHHYTLSYGMGVDYGTGCNTPYNQHHYVIYIEPEDGYCFADKPTVKATIMDDAETTNFITLTPIGRSSATTGYGYEVCSLIGKKGHLILYAEAVNLDLSTKFIEMNTLLPNEIQPVLFPFIQDGIWSMTL